MASQESIDELVERLSLAEAELATRVAEDLGSLGSMSVGKPNGGALINGVRMPEHEGWELIIPQLAWGTEETVGYLRTAVEAVRAAFPEGTHPMFIGHLSRREGGPLRPHRSHQSGRDVDLGYYYIPERAEWYRPANALTLDRARSWAFVRALVTRTDVEYIFISIRVQKLLKEYALSVGEDADWLDTLFEYRSRHPEPLIRHTWGHQTHMHVRFYNPKAQAMGIRAYDALARHRVISPRVRFQPYLAKPGDSYTALARLAGVQARTVERTNGGRPLLAGRIITVPVRGDVVRVDGLVVPSRRLPPGPSTTQATVLAAPLRD
ncbi:MAG: penicillin-insensitive murein endopeptidase [Myxococcota bacterium]